jgi:prepilin-type N-terminal cleavage/methylation domain-containing protein
MSRLSTASRRDPGFTVVELIVVVVLLGVVTSAAAGAFIISMKTVMNNFTALDQSNASLQITRSLTSDIQGASSTVTLSPGDAVCGGTAKLKLLTQSTATAPAYDTTVVWALKGTKAPYDLLRCTVIGGTVKSAYTVAKAIDSFVPACTAPCGTVTVTYVASGGSKTPARTFSLSAQRRIG